MPAGHGSNWFQWGLLAARLEFITLTAAVACDILCCELKVCMCSSTAARSSLESVLASFSARSVSCAEGDSAGGIYETIPRECLPWETRGQHSRRWERGSLLLRRIADRPDRAQRRGGPKCAESRRCAQHWKGQLSAQRYQPNARTHRPALSRPSDWIRGRTAPPLAPSSEPRETAATRQQERQVRAQESLEKRTRC